MAGIGSSRFYIKSLTKLISNYVNYESASARAMLSDMTLKGPDIVDALDNAKLDMERDSTEYEQLEEDHKELTNKLESLIKGKEGSFVEKIRNILQEYKLE